MTPNARAYYFAQTFNGKHARRAPSGSSTQFFHYASVMPEHRDGVKTYFLFSEYFLIMADNQEQYEPLSPFETGLHGKCPRCGSGDLFAGFLNLKPACSACGLDYSFADSGDGPAFFVICFSCLVGFGFVLWMHFSVGAPYWLNGILSVVLLTALSILPLRPLKGLMIAQQYQKDAHEGELSGLSDVKED